MFWSSLAFSNAKVVGNGGSVVLCKNSDNKVIKSELFDLYEGRVLNGNTYKEISDPFLHQAQNKIDQLTKSLDQNPKAEGSIQEKFDFVNKNLIFLPTGVGLKPINDIDEFILPKNCELTQTINFRIDYKIYVDSDVWSTLTETQKAALLVHETIYWYLREAGTPKRNSVEINSKRTRKAVSLLFSEANLEKVNTFKNNTNEFKIQFCRTEDALENDRPATYFYVYQTTEQKTIFQFIQLMDRVLLTNASLKSDYITSKLKPGLSVSKEIESLLDSDAYVSIDWWPGQPELNKIFVRDSDNNSSWEHFTCENI